MTIPVPGLVAVKVFSSIQPLKTEPNPPSPNILSGRKFRVAALRSLNVKLFRFEDWSISPSLRGVGGLEVADTLLLTSFCLVPVEKKVEIAGEFYRNSKSPSQANMTIAKNPNQ